MSLSFLLSGLAWLAGGSALGAAYFLLLGRSVGAISGAANRRGAAGYLMVRIGLAVAVFAAAAMQGAKALLFALTGFLIARAVAMARAQRRG